MATNTGSPYFIPFPEDNDPVDVAGDFEILATHLNNNLEEYISDTVAVLVTGNTENGINVTVDESTNKINFDVNDPIISISGDVAGSATMTNLGNTTINVDIQPNSVALGTDTTGPYVATIEGTENQIIVLGSGTEDSDVILSLPQDVDEGANPTFAGAYLGEIQVGITGDNEIDTTVGDLTIDSEGGTITLDDDVVVTGDFDVDHIDFDTTRVGDPSQQEGRMYYDTTSRSINFMDNTLEEIHLGRVVYAIAINNTGTTIARNKVVSALTFDNVTGYPQIVLSSKTSPSTVPALGITMESIEDGELGKVLIFGYLENVNTAGLTPGDTIYLSTSGNWTTTRPVNTEEFQILGSIGKSATDGQILVNVDPNSSLVPNLQENYIWIGNEDNHAVETRDPNLNSLTLDSDIAVNGGDITTDAVTFNLLNANATTINFGGAATNIQIGAATGTTNVNNDLDVDGDVNVDGGDITTNLTTFNLLNTNATTVNFAGAGTDIQIGSSTGTTNVNNNLDVDGDINIDGGDLTVSASTFNLANTNATTINFGGAATSVEIAAATGTTRVKNNLEVDGNAVVDGNLTVHGTTTTINSVVSTTDDPIFVIGGDTLPTTDDNKDRGVEFRWHNGTSAKTGFFGFDDSTGRFTFIPDGTNTSEVFSGTLGDVEVNNLHVAGIVPTGGTLNISQNLDVDGDINVDGGDFTTASSTFNLLNTTATTINLGGVATDIQIGSSTGTTNVNNNLDVDGDVNIDGGDLTVSTSTFNLINTTATTVNFAGAATDIQIGSSSGTTNVNNNLDVDGDINIDGGDLTASTSTFNLLHTPTTINFGAAATTIEIGSANGTTNVNNNLDVDGDINIDGGDLTASTSTFNLLHTPTTINFGVAATDIQIGSASGTTNINNNLDVDGDISIDGGDLTATTSAFNLLNNTVTTLNFAGAATAITIGALTGTTTIRNNVAVDGNITINPDASGPAFILGANATGQLITGLNADLLDDQTGSWYQARANHTGTQLHSTISDWDEATQDVVGDMFAHNFHSNIIAEYNDVSGIVVLTAPGLGSGFGNTAGVTAAQMYWFGV